MKEKKIKKELPDDVRAYLSEIGKRGGRSTSEAKRKSSAENGKAGGRPKGSRNKKKADA